MTYPAIIFLAVLLWSFTWPKENLVYLLFGTAAFGSLAVLPPTWVGGADLLPSSLAAVVLAGRFLADRRFCGSLVRNAFSLARLGLFTDFMLLAAISAVFFPRFFEGLPIIAMRSISAGGVGSDVLRPTSANFTQLAYLGVTYVTTLVIFSRANDSLFVSKMFKAFMLGACLLVASGLADLVLGGSGASPLLAPYKTAAYAILEGAEVLGVRRIVGLMSEASAFGATCVTYGAVCLFAASALPTRQLRLFATAIAIATLMMAALSTSSTAIAGLAVLGAFYGVNTVRRSADALMSGKNQAHRMLLLTEFSALYFVGAALAISLMIVPDLLLMPSAFLDALIFKKSLGGSYYERMRWNQIAIDALADTHGIGVGVGGARTSNWIVAVLSSTGILGAVLLFGFIGIALLRPLRSKNTFVQESVAGARFAVATTLFMASLAGTSPDFGLSVGALLAIIVVNFANKNTRILTKLAPVARRDGLNKRFGDVRPIFRSVQASARAIKRAAPQTAPGEGKIAPPRAPRMPKLAARQLRRLRLKRWTAMHPTSRPPRAGGS